MKRKIKINPKINPTVNQAIVTKSSFDLNQIIRGRYGKLSSRRLAAIFSLLFSAFITVMIIYYKDIINWYIFIPVALFLAFSLVLFFFTTWEQIIAMVKAIKGEEVKGDGENE